MNPIPKIAEIVSYFKTNWTELLTIEQLELRNVRYYYQTELPEKQSFVSAVALNGVLVKVV